MAHRGLPRSSHPTLPVALSINGKPVSAHVNARVTLLDFLRERALADRNEEGL